MEKIRNLRIYGDGTKYYLIINKKGVEKQKLYFDSIPKLKSFIKKYKKKIKINKPKIKQPKKTFNNIVDNLGIGRITYNPIWQMEIMKNEQIQNEINKLSERINKKDLERVEKGENILTDTDYKKNINKSPAAKPKYNNPDLNEIIEWDKQTTDIFNKLNDILGKFNKDYEEDKKINEDMENEINENLQSLDLSNISGKGVLLYGNGISNITINKIMSKFKSFGYIGCFSFDELIKVFKYIVKNKLKHFSFILNTADNNKDKINPLHWVAVYCDGASLEYYDCSGGNIRFKEFKYIASKFIPLLFNHYLKLKYNNIVNQPLTSNWCGFYAMKFLISRYIGISFKDATNYKNTDKNEKNINEFRKNINKFRLL